MFEILIRGGSVADGTGRPAFAADVAVSGGRIAAVGDLRGASAAQVWDASGKTVTPGFIDIHRHADAALLRPGFGAAELCQGLTTIVNGNCGLSCAPFGGDHGQAIRDYLRPITGEIPAEMATGSLADYFASLPALPLHMGMLAGAGVLRADAAGYELEHLESGGVFGEMLMFENVAGDSITVVAETACRVWFMAADQVTKRCEKACAHHTQVVENMCQLVAGKATSLYERVEVLSRRSIRDKLMCYFSLMAAKNRSGEFLLPFSLSALADYISTDRSAMMRELKKMRQEELVDVHGRKVLLQQGV